MTCLLSKLDVSKSMGPDDGMKYNESFIFAITKLFNKCIKDENIPSIWKTAIVVPIHKKGPENLPSNYRPVSLTCILCKVYEKFISTHILNFIKDKIISNQHSFVQGKLTLSNLLETIDCINEFFK